MIQKSSLHITKLFNLIILIITCFFFVSCDKKLPNPSKIDIGDGNSLLPGAKNKDNCTEYHLINDQNLPTSQMIYYVDNELNYSGSYDVRTCI